MPAISIEVSRYTVRPLAAVLLWVTGMTAVGDVLDSTAGGLTLQNTRVVPTDPAATWTALVEAVDRWWPKDHTWWGAASRLAIDARAGGCFCEIAGDRQAQHMAIVFVEPGRLLRMTGGLGPLQGMGIDGVLEWRLEPQDAGTRITLFYRVGGYTPDDLAKFAPVVDQVQALQLGGLVKYLEATHPPE